MDAEKIERVVKDCDNSLDMWAFLRAYEEFAMWRRVRRLAENGDEHASMFARTTPADLPEIADLDALRVTTRLADHMLRTRWMVMLDARESGASWSDIAIAIGLAFEHDDPERIKTAAAEARAWYVEQIELQEKHLGDLHDAARARAVVGDASPESPNLSTG